MKTIEIEYYKKNGVDARKSCEKLKVQKKNQENFSKNGISL